MLGKKRAFKKFFFISFFRGVAALVFEDFWRSFQSLFSKCRLFSLYIFTKTIKKNHFAKPQETLILYKYLTINGCVLEPLLDHGSICRAIFLIRYLMSVSKAPRNNSSSFFNFIFFLVLVLT